MVSEAGEKAVGSRRAEVRKIGKCLVWVSVYVAFLGASFLIRQRMMASGELEIWSWDYQNFIRLFHEWGYVFYTGFRHPGLGIVYSPIVVATHIWSEAYVVIMPLIATAMAWMVWRLAGGVGLAVWLSFPTTWILAGTPESFPIAELALTGTVGVMLKAKGFGFQVEGGWLKEKSGKLEVESWKGEMERRMGWEIPALVLGCAVMCGMITITNGLKPVLAFLALAAVSRDRRQRKWVWPLLGAMAAVGVAGVAFFYVRALISGKDVVDCIQRTIVWVPAERMWGKELHDFFVRPVGVWQSCVVYPLAAWCLWRLVRSRMDFPLLAILGAMFAVDVGIHWVCGWGMKEAWVYAPHWLWMLPIVIGRGVKVKV